MDANDDPYEILGLSRDATEADIKKAYRKLALKNHPDKQTTEEEREKANAVFAKISNAYQILSDNDLRRKYECRKKKEEFSAQSPRRARTRHYKVPREETNSLNAPFSPSPKASFTSRKVRTDNNGTTSRFQSTATTDDGTTFSFSFSSDQFDSKFEDPFEVFKKMYREEFGKEFDNVRPTVVSPKTPTRVVLQKGTFVSPSSGKTNQSSSQIPRRSSKSSPARPPMTLKSSQTRRNNSLMSPPLVDEGKPFVSMSSSTKQIQHSDGRVETITEVTKMFADGTVSTQRQSSTSTARTGSYKTISTSPMRMQPRQAPTAIKALAGGL